MKHTLNIIWIFGGSAAGKERFITYTAEKKPNALLQRLGWENKVLRVCKESLAWVALDKHDPKRTLRKKLPERITVLAKTKPDIILVKGQDDDLIERRVQATKKLLPSAQHAIIFLHVPVTVAYARWKEKQWKKRFWYSTITVRRWLSRQLKTLQKLQPEFPITALDSSNDEYKTILFPPKL